MNTAREEHLNGIEAILKQECPELCHHIQRLLRQKPISENAPGTFKLGGTVFRVFAVEMRIEDAKAILEVLQSVCQKFGREKKIGGMGFCLLAGVWGANVEKLQASLSSTPATPPPSPGGS